MKQTFYSNGKLLITGEYVVLEGAKAFALPTSYGQYLHIEQTGNNIVKWISKDADESVWLNAEIPFNSIKTNKQEGSIAEVDTLVNILHKAHISNPDIINASKGFNIITELTFPRHWGLGTSSTLINNIAQWFGINAFLLLQQSFGGSGYDIACAQNNTPILYQLNGAIPLIEKVSFKPAFSDSLYFVYLNKKQNSRSAIQSYKQKGSKANAIETINNLTKEVLQANDLTSLMTIMERHEDVMSGILGLPTAKEALFPDFNGTVKSLGAWGGDFVLVASAQDPIPYLKGKGFTIIIPYNEMILQY